jgi:hypothetical protein
VREKHGDVKRLWGKLHGQEKNLTTSPIARMNLFLHGIENFQIVHGDTLCNPAFFDGNRLATFDCVLANPPFSLEKWGEEMWEFDPFGRNFAGLPPSSSGDFAWVQHMAKSIADGSGRMAVVLPQGALFRKGAEDHAWLRNIVGNGLSAKEAKALIYARETDAVDNAACRDFCGLDTLTASLVLRRLRDRGLLLKGFGEPDALCAERRKPWNSHKLEPELVGIPDELRQRIQILGKKPRQSVIRGLPRELCALRPYSALELCRILGRGDARELTRSHLKPHARSGHVDFAISGER